LIILCTVDDGIFTSRNNIMESVHTDFADC